MIILYLIFSGLHVIELANNPWACDCRLRPLKHWLVSNNVPYSMDPKCARPPRLAGQQFANLQVDEFACPPELLSAPRYVEANVGKFVFKTELTDARSNLLWSRCFHEKKKCKYKNGVVHFLKNYYEFFVKCPFW